MPDGAVASGTVVEAVENERLVVSWGWTGAPFEMPPGSTTVTIDLSPTPEGTRIRLSHSGLPADLNEHHRGGWEMCLDQLASELLDAP
jgi:uncharacterized protein YndB with AHSA1/START domain